MVALLLHVTYEPALRLQALGLLLTCHVVLLALVRPSSTWHLGLFEQLPYLAALAVLLLLANSMQAPANPGRPLTTAWMSLQFAGVLLILAVVALLLGREALRSAGMGIKHRLQVQAMLQQELPRQRDSATSRLRRRGPTGNVQVITRKSSLHKNIVTLEPVQGLLPVPLQTIQSPPAEQYLT